MLVIWTTVNILNIESEVEKQQVTELSLEKNNRINRNVVCKGKVKLAEEQNDLSHVHTPAQ